MLVLKKAMQTPFPEPRITRDMTVLDVVSQYRSTEAVFRRYDGRVGKCICCTCLFETIGDVTRAHGLDLETFLHDLEDAACGDTSQKPSSD